MILNLLRKLVGINSIRSLSLSEGDIIVVKGKNPGDALSFAQSLGNAALANYPVPILCVGENIDMELLRNMPADYKASLMEALNA